MTLYFFNEETQRVEKIASQKVYAGTNKVTAILSNGHAMEIKIDNLFYIVEE